MGSVNLFGESAYHWKRQQPDKFDLKSSLSNISKGFADENIIAMVVKDRIAHGENSNPFNKKDPNYNVYNDPQFRGLEEYMGNFLHANNKEHAAFLIKEFIEGTDSYKSSPAYIVGRILGGLTDPTSLFMFTKASNFLFQGARLARGIKAGSVIAGEELLKANIDPNRPITDSALITAGGFILPAIFPAIPKGAAKNFDRTSNFYDKVDEYYRAGGSVGAKANMKDELFREAEELNKISPTGMGILGENSRTTPVFRTMQEKIGSAQDFIERTLEIPLFQKKNFLDGITYPSIERNIKARYHEVIAANEEMMTFYDLYLQYKGKSGRNFVEKLVDRKFTFDRDVVNPTKFREMVFEKMLMGKNYKIAMQDDRVNDLVKQAAESQRKFYDNLVDQYDTLKVVPAYLETNIERLSFFKDLWIKKLNGEAAVEKRAALQAKIANISIQIKKLQNRLDIVKTNGIRRRDYVNIVFKRDAIDARFSDFERILRKILSNKNDPSFAKLTPNEIDEIVASYKNYQPIIQFENVWDIVGKQIPNLEHVNKISSRFYSRHIDLGKNGYKELMDAGFLEKDLTYLNRLYFNQVVPDIEITKVFGDPLGLGSRALRDPESPYSDGLLRIDLDYERLIRDNFENKKLVSKLKQEKKEALEDAYAGIQLVQGTRGLAQDPNRLQSRLIRMAKLYNATTMLTGLSQIVDLARLITTNGIRKTFGINWDILTSGMAKEIYLMNKKSINLGGEALDLATSSTVMRMYDIDDAYGVFNQAEKAFSQMGNIYFTFFNAANPWNTFVKSLSSIYNSTRMLEAIEGWVVAGKISNVNKARLQSVSIDKAMAEKIWDQYTRHGVGKNGGVSLKMLSRLNGGKVDFKYIRSSNSAMWDDPDVAKVFNDALGKQGNIDIVTPSKGDVPLWTNSEMGGLIAQFKKWAFSSTQRIAMRGLQERDKNQMIGLMLLMMGGAAVDAIRTEQSGKSYDKKKASEKLIDAFDRSGAGGIFSDINNNFERLTNNQMGLRPLLGAKRPYGTYRDLFNNPVVDVFGPTSSQLANISDIMWAWGTGSYNHHDARNVRRLIPFQNIWWLDTNFDKIEKGLR